MKRKLPSAIILIVTLAALWASAIPHAFCERPRRAGAQGPQSPAPTGLSDSASDEGCKVHAYTGTTPLEQLPNYFNGEEDLRGGMTCAFHINAMLPTFIFHFPGKPDNTFGNIDITERSSGKPIQTIENSTEPGLVAPAPVSGVLTVVDANFDGYKDLQILSNCGGTGNCSYDFYLYDPKTGTFVHNQFLSSLTTPSFDDRKKQVTTVSNSSAADWDKDTYQYKGGEYTLIHREASEWDREKNVVTVSTYELRNGKLELVNSETSPE